LAPLRDSAPATPSAKILSRSRRRDISGWVLRPLHTTVRSRWRSVVQHRARPVGGALERLAFHSRSFPPTQRGYAALHTPSAGERHRKKANQLQSSRHPIRVSFTPALAHAPPPIRRITRPPTPQLSSRFDSRATHVRTLLPAALASLPFGCVLVRVAVTATPWHPRRNAPPSTAVPSTAI
jgi:hypothetical protein